MAKVTSVLQLARYKVGDLVWRLDLNTVNASCLYEPLYKWDNKQEIAIAKTKIGRLPRIDSQGHNNFVSFAASDLEVVEYTIDTIYRCPKTGEFWYKDLNSEDMPESCLFDTKVAARIERSRLVKIIKEWVKRNG